MKETIVYRLSRLFGVVFPEILIIRDKEEFVLPVIDAVKTTISLPDLNIIGLVSNDLGGIFSASKGRDVFSTEKNSIWIIESDLIIRGELDDKLKHVKIEGMVAVFGIQLSDELVEILKLCFAIINKIHKLDVKPIYALYKGLGPDSINKFIEFGCKTIESEEGMLGVGVYLGSFWKACRYAGWSSSDVSKASPPFQGGFVLRYYIWGGNIATPPWRQCQCATHPSKIEGRIAVDSSGRQIEIPGCRHTKPGWYDFVARQYVDHLSTWRESYDCAVVKPVLLEGTDRDIWRNGRLFTKRAYIVRNEEWITKLENVFFVSAAMVDWTSFKEDKYDPRQRDIKIF